LKSFFKNIQTLLIVVLVIIILLLRNCKSDPKPNPVGTVVVKTETTWDTIREKIPTYIPKWYTQIEYRDTTIYSTLYKDVDTSEILKDYFATYVYFDTLAYDSINIRIKDTITQNRIKNRSIEYDLIYSTTTITRDSIVNNRGFYAGIGVGGSTSQLNYIGGEFLFKSKKRTAFGLGVGVNTKFEPVFIGKLYWKLGK
jgi:hypothetical protein